MSLFSHLNKYLDWPISKSWKEEILSVNIPFGPQSGPYDLTYTPYFESLIDDLDDEDLEIISLMVPSQTGKSILLLVIGILWAIKYAVPVYYVLPTVGSGTEFMNSKVYPLLINNKRFVDMLEKDENGKIDRSAIKLRAINFINGGSFTILAAGSRQDLKGKTTNLVIIDELAECYRQSSNALGDVIERAHSRIAQYTGTNRKLLVAGTPVIAHQDIHALAEQSRRYKYLHTCTQCNNASEIVFENLSIDGVRKIDSIDIQRSAIENKTKIKYTCPECGKVYWEYEKRDMLTRCQWVKQNSDGDFKLKSYAFQGTYGSKKWSDIYLKYLSSRDNPQSFRVFKNETLAEPWELYKPTTIKFGNLARGVHQKGQLPLGVLAISTGIDIQTTTREAYVNVIGFTPNGQYYLIDWAMYNFESMADLENIIKELHSSKYGDITNSYTFVDSGSAGHTIVSICSRVAKKCIPIKGASSISSLVYMPTTQSQNKDRPLLVHPHETTAELELAIHEGNLIFPVDFNDMKYFEHLTSEIQETKGGKTIFSVKSKSHNDYKDSLRYAIYCGLYYNLNKIKRSTWIDFG